MQFNVPQFIEMESKIIGPLTFKQVIYIGGSLGISYVLVKVLPNFIAIPIVIVVLIFGWALTFLPKQKYGKPFISIVEAAFKYITRDRLYTWKRGVKKPKTTATEEYTQTPVISIPKISGNKLTDLSKELEVGERQEK